MSENKFYPQKKTKKQINNSRTQLQNQVQNNYVPTDYRNMPVANNPINYSYYMPSQFNNFNMPNYTNMPMSIANNPTNYFYYTPTQFNNFGNTNQVQNNYVPTDYRNMPVANNPINYSYHMPSQFNNFNMPNYTNMPMSTANRPMNYFYYTPTQFNNFGGTNQAQPQIQVLANQNQQMQQTAQNIAAAIGGVSGINTGQNINGNQPTNGKKNQQATTLEFFNDSNIPSEFYDYSDFDFDNSDNGPSIL